MRLVRDEELFANDAQFEGSKGRPIAFNTLHAYTGTLEGKHSSPIVILTLVTYPPPFHEKYFHNGPFVWRFIPYKNSPPPVFQATKFHSLG